MKASPPISLQLLAFAVVGCTATAPSVTPDINWNALPIQVTVLDGTNGEIEPASQDSIEIREILRAHLRSPQTEASDAAPATGETHYIVFLRGRDEQGKPIRKRVTIGDGWIRDANKQVQLSPISAERLHQIIGKTLSHDSNLPTEPAPE